MNSYLFFQKFLMGVTLLLGSMFLPCQAQTLQNQGATFSQRSILSNYISYHNIVKENVYAHLNKTSFLAGESIWFKIYITNAKTGMLEFRTNKVYTDLFAPDGSLYWRSIWHVQDGCAFGQINLSDTLVGGTYTFKTYTNWQQNFEPERMFSTQVQVKSFEEYEHPTQSVSVASWDIQLFPEGGDLIAGTTSRIAVKGVDQYGNGRKFSGKVMSDQTELLAFETNDLGMGSFLLPKEYSGQNNLQTVISLSDGRTQQVPLPKAKDLGVSLQVNAIGKERIDIFLNTNASTLQAFANRPFYCMVHQNGLIAELYQINSLENQFTKLQIAKEQLPAGICTVTLFDHSFRPISERLFFAHSEEASGAVDIVATRSRDSVEVRLKTTDSGGSAAPALLSAAVLPAKSMAGNFTSNIYAHFFLTADLRGDVENPAFYFMERTVERLQALDNLLLTQAWRKHDWNTILNGNAQPMTPYVFEYGFQVSGKAMRQTFVGNVSTAKSEVVLNMPTPPFTKYAHIATDGSFIFDSLLIYKPFNRLFLMAMDKKGDAGNRLLQDVSAVTPLLDKQIRPKRAGADESRSEAVMEIESDDSWLQFVEPNSTLLTAAVVTAKRPTARDIMVNDPFVSPVDKYFQITEENMGFYKTPFDVLQSVFGLFVFRDTFDNIMVKTHRAPLVLFGEAPPMVLILNGVPVRDWNVLDVFTIDDIESISVHPGPNTMLGSDGTFGSVSIKTRVKSLRSRSNAPNFAQLAVDGYDAPAAYYTPLYSNISNKTNLTSYSCLHWEPDLASITGETVFRFYSPTAEQSVRIRVEGIAGDGMLFSKDTEVVISK